MKFAKTNWSQMLKVYFDQFLKITGSSGTTEKCAQSARVLYGMRDMQKWHLISKPGHRKKDKGGKVY